MKKLNLLVILSLFLVGCFSYQTKTFIGKDGKTYTTTWECVREGLVPVYEPQLTYDWTINTYRYIYVRNYQRDCIEWKKDTIQVVYKEDLNKK